MDSAAVNNFCDHTSVLEEHAQMTKTCSLRIELKHVITVYSSWLKDN